MARTHYENLKVAQDAPEAVIRAAYRVLAQKYHPDLNKSPNAERIMKIINEAYAVLMDPVQRAEHDAWIAEQRGAANAAPEEPEQHQAQPGADGNPSQHPPTEERPASRAEPAGAWRRFAARSVDVWLTCFTAGFGCSFFIHRIWPKIGAHIEAGIGQFVFVLGVLFVAMLLDAFCYGVFGNTPGKAAFGVFVTDRAGRPLSEQQYSVRNIEVWIYGLACGIPVLNLFTMAAQHSKLTKRGGAGYDEGRYAVWVRPVGWVQDAVAILGCVCVMAVQGLLTQVYESSKRVDDGPGFAQQSATEAPPLLAPQATDQVRRDAASALQFTADEIKKVYPQLDYGSAVANVTAINFVIARRDEMMAQQGLQPDEALRRATALAAERFSLVPSR